MTLYEIWAYRLPRDAFNYPEVKRTDRIFVNRDKAEEAVRIANTKLAKELGVHSGAGYCIEEIDTED